MRIDFDAINDTELITLAQLNGIPGASRAVPRDTLIRALTLMIPITDNNPIDDYAIRMSNWLKKYWDRLQDTAPKSCCPDCPGCGDVQVVMCYTVNKESM